MSMTKRLHLVYRMLVYVSVSQPFWAETQTRPVALPRDPRAKK